VPSSCIHAARLPGLTVPIPRSLSPSLCQASPPSVWYPQEEKNNYPFDEPSNLSTGAGGTLDCVVASFGQGYRNTMPRRFRTAGRGCGLIGGGSAILPSFFIFALEKAPVYQLLIYFVLLLQKLSYVDSNVLLKPFFALKIFVRMTTYLWFTFRYAGLRKRFAPC
jgi:hypothetical protein